MLRFKAALLITAALAAWTCFGQTEDHPRSNPDKQDLDQRDLERLLLSGPRDVAWAAHTIAEQKRREMIPSLAAFITSYQGAPIEKFGSMPPEAAAIEAVADALIRLQAAIPGALAMRLYPQFPAQTVILLSRASDNTAPLLEIFQNTSSRELWLAVGNLLALHPTQEFVRPLLSGFVATFTFSVVAPSEQTRYVEEGGGCAGDFMMRRDPAFADWPKTRMYRLITGTRPQNVFAPGIHPVGFTSWESTDYRDPWTDSDCSLGKSKDWRAGVLAELLGKDLKDFPLKPETQETVRYSSAESFEASVQATIEGQSAAFRDLLPVFARSGLLAIEDEFTLHLKCRIQVQDTRPGPREALPPVEGKWCVPAPPQTRPDGPPE